MTPWGGQARLIHGPTGQLGHGISLGCLGCLQQPGPHRQTRAGIRDALAPDGGGAVGLDSSFAGHPQSCNDRRIVLRVRVSESSFIGLNMRSDLDYRTTATNAALETASLAAQVLMFGFGFLPSRHKTQRDEALHTIVFVHGLGANRASLYPVQAYLAARGHRRQYSFSYPTLGSIESCAITLKERIDRDIKGGRIDLVCHSLGGLVGRFYVQQLGGARRVHRMITLATPNMGTHATAWLPTTAVRQMTPGSPFLTHLNGLPPPKGVQLTSFGVDADLLVLPPINAKAPFGTHHQHPRLGHTGLLFSPTVLRQTFDALGPTMDGVPVVRQAQPARQLSQT